MAKRAARRAKLHAIDSARIHNLVFDHTPANDRDQSYIRKIRPRSDNQRILMEAIDTKPLTVALGPAGTGKTYLAISAAVEALEAGTRLAHRAVASGRRGRREPGLPARRHARKARSLPAPPVGRPERPAGRQAPAPEPRRRHDRDRAGGLHARPHPQQQLRADRRGAELHLRPDQDAADAARLALDHGDDRRPRPDRPAARTVGPGRRSPRSWKGSTTSPSCA